METPIVLQFNSDIKGDGNYYRIGSSKIMNDVIYRVMIDKDLSQLTAGEKALLVKAYELNYKEEWKIYN